MCSWRMKPRLQAEWAVSSEQELQACFSQLLFESNEEKFSFRWVERDWQSSTKRSVAEHAEGRKDWRIRVEYCQHTDGGLEKGDKNEMN